MSHMSTLFGALSDPVRLEIVEMLMTRGEMAAGDICQQFDISGPAVSRHLSVLLNSGLVTRKIDGKRRLYKARPEAIKQVSDWGLDHRAFWEASMDRLAAMLSEETP